MTLMKSKINSLAWLKSAIYISVVGGVILSSKSASAVSVTFGDYPILGTYSMIEPSFGSSIFPQNEYTIEGQYWTGTVNVNEIKGAATDGLLLIGLFQHNQSPHPEDNPTGRQFTFNFFLNASNAIGNEINASKTELLGHPENHSDLFEAKLIANVFPDTAGSNRITNWTFTLSGEHKSEPVPEPTTIFGSALALGVGGWLKRKKSSQHNKTTPH